jgi:hypothetical protein
MPRWRTGAADTGDLGTGLAFPDPAGDSPGPAVPRRAVRPGPGVKCAWEVTRVPPPGPADREQREGIPYRVGLSPILGVKSSRRANASRYSKPTGHGAARSGGIGTFRPVGTRHPARPTLRPAYPGPRRIGQPDLPAAQTGTNTAATRRRPGERPRKWLGPRGGTASGGKGPPGWQGPRAARAPRVTRARVARPRGGTDPSGPVADHRGQRPELARDRVLARIG